MTAPRLAASVEASGFIRQAEAEGGFGTILRRGDKERGSLLIVVRCRGAYVASLERMLGMDGSYNWARLGPEAGASESDIAQFLQKRARFDEDSWAIELDIAHPERFIAETTSAG